LATPVTQRERITATHVDLVLFRLRWIVLLISILVAWLGAGSFSFPISLWAWFGVVAAANLILGLLLFTKNFPPSFSIATLILDTFLFGLLPYLANSDSNYLALVSIFPALVGTIRYGPAIGFAIATLLALSLGFHALLLSARQPNTDLLSTATAIVTMIGLILLTGYLTKHEKAAAVKRAASELDDLRGAMAGAKMLYKSTDILSLTTNYKTVLEGMLEAGVDGLPKAREQDGPSVGIALFFDDNSSEQKLRVVASRHLEIRDEEQQIPGKTGIVAETLKTGAAVVFDKVNLDPELTAYGALQRCRSGVCYPLQAGLNQYGVVVMATPAPRRPSAQHLELMRAFTSQAGIAFQNAKLYQSSRVEQDKIIHSENEMRQKLARDLHDGPTQKIAGLVMQLDYINQLLTRNPEEAKKELEKARGIAQQTVKEIRTALFTLRPLALETKGLSAALAQYGERLRETERLAIKVEPGNFGSELDTNVAATVFAIIDEAVTNARKHTRRAPIYVSAENRNNTLIAIVRDEGAGFNVDQVIGSYDNRSSLGLQNMRDRALLINGELRIESEPGKGTRVTLIVPLGPLTPEAMR
jgi:signal transduction histidine kinase